MKLAAESGISTESAQVFNIVAMVIDGSLSFETYFWKRRWIADPIHWTGIRLIICNQSLSANA